jgi:hypothetical protein
MDYRTLDYSPKRTKRTDTRRLYARPAALEFGCTGAADPEPMAVS